MEGVVERENLKKALAQVKRNKGAAGIDGMSVDDLPAYLKEHWPTIRAQLLEGTYTAQPVRRVEIPKASGGTRPLGIASVLDRFIQQAVMQVLQADWDGTFHRFAKPPLRLTRPDFRRRPTPRIIYRAAVYGPVRTVAWEGWSREAPPYPDCEKSTVTVNRPKASIDGEAASAIDL